MEVALNTALEKQVWLSKEFREYVRESGYKPYMGTENTNIIIAKYELQEESGKTINIPLITRLKGAGVTGSQVADGAEEDLANYNCAISIDWRRKPVRIPKSTSYKTQIDLWDAAKTMIRTWFAEQLRDDHTRAFLSIIPATTTVTPVEYGTITEDTANGGYEITVANQAAGASQANLDAWLVLNKDRVVFGALAANYTAGDHSAALLTLDTTADKMSTAIGSFAKRRARAASPHIRPYKTKTGREFFVCFVGPRSMRDLKLDASLLSANRDARPRSVEENPIFQDGDEMYNGVLYHEVPEIPHITNAGASSTTDVEPFFLCGAQAIGAAWGQKLQLQEDLQKDYKFRPGVCGEELLRVQKLHFNGVQQGMVTGYVAAAPDA